MADSGTRQPSRFLAPYRTELACPHPGPRIAPWLPDDGSSCGSWSSRSSRRHPGQRRPLFRARPVGRVHHRQSLTIRIELLIPAGLLYLLAHCCWGSFWVRLLWEQGIPVTLYTGLRSYFVSQLGKYVPGKAWVLLMRVGMLGAAGTKLAVGMTATYETLTNMAAGTLLGIAFLPYLGVLPPIVSANLGWLIGLAALPLLLAVLNKLAARVAAQARSGCAALPSPSLLLLAQGLLHGACG